MRPISAFIRRFLPPLRLTLGNPINAYASLMPPQLNAATANAATAAAAMQNFAGGANAFRRGFPTAAASAAAAANAVNATQPIASQNGGAFAGAPLDMRAAFAYLAPHQQYALLAQLQSQSQPQPDGAARRRSCRRRRRRCGANRRREGSRLGK